MSSLVLLIICVVVFVLGYRFYSRLLTLGVFRLDVNYSTPAQSLADDKDIVASNRQVILGHHVAIIAGPTTIVGSAVAVIWGILITMFVLSAAVAGSIHDAAKNGNIDQVKQLIAAGTNVDARDDAGHTPLQLAAGTGHTAVVQLLITEGADVNAKDMFDGTPLWDATLNGHEAAVELLVTHGANVNAKTKIENDDITPLDEATRKGHKGIIELLKRHGAKCGTSPIWSC